MWHENIRALKAASGLKTWEISERSGVPKATLEKIFAGKTKEPKLETMRAIASALGCSLEDLTAKKENPPAGVDQQRESLEKVLRSAGRIPQERALTEADRKFLQGIDLQIDFWFDKTP